MNLRRLYWFTWIVTMAAIVTLFAIRHDQPAAGPLPSGLALIALAATVLAGVLGLYGVRCPQCRLPLAVRGTARERLVPGQHCPQCHHDLHSDLQ